MYFKYVITYWDTYETKEATDEGIVRGKSYGKAINKVVEDYGKDCIISILLEEIESSNCLSKCDFDEAFRSH